VCPFIEYFLKTNGHPKVESVAMHVLSNECRESVVDFFVSRYTFDTMTTELLSAIVGGMEPILTMTSNIFVAKVLYFL
jgi:hypothetical protein